jgi:predicted ATPase/DNA-binding XRE family transcriptional regulator
MTADAVAAPTFGDLLRRHRVAAHLTQEELAERAGLSARGISDLERGARTHPYRETLLLLADALSLDAAERTAFLRAARGQTKPEARARDAAPLPAPPTPLVGRSAQIAEVSGLLRQEAVRLVTLTGPGGVGKTRLALAVADVLSGELPAGAVFVDLAPLRDPGLVVAKIAATLGLSDQGTVPLADIVRRFLAERRMLLMLDNYEHLLGAAMVVSELLQAGPSVKALVTSREALRLRGEREYAVPPLALPDLHPSPDPDALAESDAVQLFVQRATDVQAGFRLTPENTATVAVICQRLDGLPLAIELAAARVKVLPPPALLARLERRLSLLTGGPRDAPERQQTLRDAIAWSYDLLSPDEQTLFQRLGTFVGGWTLDTAEAVVGDDEIDVLQGISSLVEKSLVRGGDAPDGEPRFRMLETVREFALERLAASGEETATRALHAAHFVALAEATAAKIRGPAQVEALDRLEADLANIRAAFVWLAEREDIEAVARLSVAMGQFWVHRGHVGEARGWIDRVLLRADLMPESLRLQTLQAATGFARVQGDRAEARRRGVEALALARALGSAPEVIESLQTLAMQEVFAAELDRAVELVEEALTLQSATGAPPNPFVPYALGAVEHRRGHLDQAMSAYEEAFALFRVAGDRQWIADSLDCLGDIHCDREQPVAALDRYSEALQLWWELKDGWGVADSLVGFVDVAATAGQPERAARLLGAADALYERAGIGVPPFDRPNYKRGLKAAQTQLGEERFTVLRAEGRTMTAEQAIDEAQAFAADMDQARG